MRRLLHECNPTQFGGQPTRVSVLTCLRLLIDEALLVVSLLAAAEVTTWLGVLIRSANHRAFSDLGLNWTLVVDFPSSVDLVEGRMESYAKIIQGL